MNGGLAALRFILLGALIVLAGMAGLAWYYQDTIGEALINPDRSYEAYTPPDAPDYGQEDAWLSRGGGQGPADVFFIHSNYYRGDGHWNAPYNRDTQLEFLTNVLLPVESDPFAAQGPLWAPRYRQPTLYARFTQKHPGAASRDTAFEDIEAAFELFLAERRPNRPLIVVGYGDGALFAGRLWLDRVAPDPELRRHTAAVYAVGMPLPSRLFESSTCQAEDQPRCIIAFTPVDARFTTYQDRLRNKTLTLSRELGYISTSGVGKLCAPPALPATVTAVNGSLGVEVETPLDATCVEGLLIFEPPADKNLRTQRFFGLQWLPSGINLFAEPLANDAALRVIGADRLLAKEAMTAPPFGAPQEIRPSEINKVPELEPR